MVLGKGACSAGLAEHVTAYLETQLCTSPVEQIVMGTVKCKCTALMRLIPELILGLFS